MNYIYKYTFLILRRRKRRILLSALAIALGISLIVQTEITRDSLKDSYFKVFLNSYSERDISVYNSPGTGQLYSPQTISNDFEIMFYSVVPLISIDTTVFFEDKGQIEQSVSLWAIDENIQEDIWGKLHDESGKEVKISELNGSSAAISSKLSEKLGVIKGDEILITLIREDGSYFSHPISITNIYTEEDFGQVGVFSDHRRIIMNLQEVQQLVRLTINSPINMVWIAIANHGNEPFLGREVTNKAVDDIYSILSQSYNDYQLSVTTKAILFSSQRRRKTLKYESFRESLVISV